MLHGYRNFIFYIKTENLYVDISKDRETRFDTSNYELEKPLPKGKTKKVIGLVREKLGDKQMVEFVPLKPKTYGSLTDDNDQNKQAKYTKTVS